MRTFGKMGLICAGLVLTWSAAYGQELQLSCPSPGNHRQLRRYSGYTVRLLPSPLRGYRCRAVVNLPPSKTGQTVSKTVARDYALAVSNLSGTDINGDGKPELIVQGYSGGAHCCYTYHIIGLGPGLPVIREIHNQVPISFVKREDGTVELRTGDGVFDYFLLPHSDAVIPKVFLRLEGDQLVDLSHEHLAEYDQQINQARGELTPAELEKLKGSNYSQNMLFDQMPVAKKVLTIVLNYVYSGREQQAWQALDDMWPPSDLSRVKNLILERRSRGLLGQVKEAPPAGS